MTILVLTIALIGPWALARAARAGEDARREAGVAGIAGLFALTGIGHFAASGEMSRMIPPSWPAREAAVLASGALELVAAAAILVPRLRRRVGWALVALLAAFLPFNVHAAVERVPFGGHDLGPAYLLVRVPFQALVAAWIVGFAIRAGPRHGEGRAGEAARRPSPFVPGTR